MSKTSKEIQSLWEQTPGDFYLDINNNVHCWTFQNAESTKMKDGFKIKEEDSLVTIEKYFWLPRLNQLIEIAQCSNKAFSDISFHFLDWAKQPYGTSGNSAEKIFNSIEQLWFAYIMKERFIKEWKDDNWY